MDLIIDFSIIMCSLSTLKQLTSEGIFAPPLQFAGDFSG